MKYKIALLSNFDMLFHVCHQTYTWIDLIKWKWGWLCKTTLTLSLSAGSRPPAIWPPSRAAYRCNLFFGVSAFLIKKRFSTTQNFGPLPFGPIKGSPLVQSVCHYQIWKVYTFQCVNFNNFKKKIFTQAKSWPPAICPHQGQPIVAIC